jgi:hypothetical protein
MPEGTLDDQYLTWLYSQVGEVKTRKSSKTYWNLLRKLFCTEFAWFVPNDDNRAEDGRELRLEWAASENIELPDNWLRLGCSFLEMLIGLARRLDFQTEYSVVDWFWKLIENMELLGYNDRSNFSETDVDDRTSTVIWRTYDHNGNGGLFPLRSASRDQREVEIWYQLCEYLLQDA